jgi:hypothetical protein
MRYDKLLFHERPQDFGSHWQNENGAPSFHAYFLINEDYIESSKGCLELGNMAAVISADAEMGRQEVQFGYES